MITVSELNQLSLAEFKPLFASLYAPTIPEIHGRYLSSFTGPRWLRAIAGPGLALGGLVRWRGKRFDGRGWGINLVERKGELAEIMPIEVNIRPSQIDLRPSLTVCYPRGSRFPWPHIVDELRVLDERTLLGMTYAQVFGLRKLTVPFLLHQE